MHIVLLAVLVIVAVAFFLFSSKPRRTNEGFSTKDSSENMLDAKAELPALTAVYLSKGKLFVKPPEKAAQEVQSPYAQELFERVERSKQCHGWKKDTAWETSFVGMRKNTVPDADAVKVIFTSVVKLAQHCILYFLKDANFGGLFLLDTSENKELRLIHKQNLEYTGLSTPNANGEILCSSAHAAGYANIVAFDEAGTSFRELTGGDSIDSAPCWVKGEDNKIVYQSQGLARNQEGYVIAVSEASIQMLDMVSGEMSTIFSEKGIDFLQPSVSANGSLYFIKRPYERHVYSNVTAVADAVLFPFRLLRAVFHYLNFFSLMYSRKPLTRASGPQWQEDIKDVLLQGKRIEAEKALKQERAIKGVPSLVPASWQLICCDASGRQHVVATNVASYCLDENDHVVYSNGCGIFVVDSTGNSHLIHKDTLVEKVAV